MDPSFETDEQMSKEPYYIKKENMTCPVPASEMVVISVLFIFISA
jgi:hypothetical protein